MGLAGWGLRPRRGCLVGFSSSGIQVGVPSTPSPPPTPRWPRGLPTLESGLIISAAPLSGDKERKPCLPGEAGSRHSRLTGVLVSLREERGLLGCPHGSAAELDTAVALQSLPCGLTRHLPTSLPAFSKPGLERGQDVWPPSSGRHRALAGHPPLPAPRLPSAPEPAKCRPALCRPP